MVTQVGTAHLNRLGISAPSVSIPGATSVTVATTIDRLTVGSLTEGRFPTSGRTDPSEEFHFPQDDCDIYWSVWELADKVGQVKINDVIAGEWRGLGATVKGTASLLGAYGESGPDYPIAITGLTAETEYMLFACITHRTGATPPGSSSGENSNIMKFRFKTTV